MPPRLTFQLLPGGLIQIPQDDIGKVGMGWSKSDQTAQKVA